MRNVLFLVGTAINNAGITKGTQGCSPPINSRLASTGDRSSRCKPTCRLRRLKICLPLVAAPDIPFSFHHFR